jgi:hypothetical protein
MSETRTTWTYAGFLRKLGDYELLTLWERTTEPTETYPSTPGWEDRAQAIYEEMMIRRLSPTNTMDHDA